MSVWLVAFLVWLLPAMLLALLLAWSVVRDHRRSRVSERQGAARQSKA